MSEYPETMKIPPHFKMHSPQAFAYGVPKRLGHIYIYIYICRRDIKYTGFVKAHNKVAKGEQIG